MYLGSFVIDDTCTLYVNSHTPSTGAAVDADAVPGYRIYEDETGTPILTGSYALLDDANTVGFYSEQITLSAANGFEAGKSYCVRSTLVVGGVTGIQIDRLQIGARVDTRLWVGTAPAAYSTTRGTAGTSLPAAAANAAGGLPISTAGGLDLDAKLANTNEVTAARMAALTDWINGGRLDLILDIIAADVVNIDGAAMRGTDNAGTAVNLALVAGYLDTEIAAIKLQTDKLVFTVANHLDVNMQYVNDTQLLGSGVAADKWRPA